MEAENQHPVGSRLVEDACYAIESGVLVDVLADWSPRLPSWFLYDPNKRQSSAAMRAFLEFVRRFTR